MDTDIAKLGLQVDTRPLKRGQVALKDFRSSARKTTQETTRFANQSRISFNRLAVAVGGLVSGFAALRGLQGVVSTTARFQDMNTVLEVLTGNVTKAGEAFDFLNDFARKTPLQLEEITNGYIRMVNNGFEPTIDALMRMADAAAIATDPSRAWRAITTSVARGQAGGLGVEELEILERQNIPIYQILTETIGRTRLEVSKLGQTAKGSKIIVEGLLKGFERYAGASEKRMGNLTTQFSNFKNEIDLAAFSFGKGLAPAIGGATEELTEFLYGNQEGFEAMGDALGRLVGTFTWLLEKRNDMSTWLYETLNDVKSAGEDFDFWESLRNDDPWTFIAKYNRYRRDYFNNLNTPDTPPDSFLADKDGHLVPSLNPKTKPMKVDISRYGNDYIPDYALPETFDMNKFTNPPTHQFAIDARLNPKFDEKELSGVSKMDFVLDDLDEKVSAFGDQVGYEWDSAVDAFVTGEEEAGRALKRFALNMGNAFEFEALNRVWGNGVKRVMTMAMDSAIDYLIPQSSGGVFSLFGIPGFASGGFHRGGARIVGEHGPELEVTGASRIFNHSDTMRMLNNKPVVVINNNASGVEVKQRATPDGSQIRVEIENVILRNLDKNGTIADRLQTKYGLKTQPRG